MPIAPIALFVYNRPEHTRKTIEALRKNDLAIESNLIIFSDGPKNKDAAVGVHEVRKYLKSISGFKTVDIVEREENYGLAKSIINGVTEIVNNYGKIVVLEDDLVTSKYFLKYMNDALDMYECDRQVASINGYIYPIKEDLPETFFIKGADCWGWGTWKRGWDMFEADGQKLLNELREKKLTKKFDFDNAYPYSQMLKMQIVGLNNSWAIRWHASAFLKNKLTLYPGKSLVHNIGNDDSGTHSGTYSMFDVEVSGVPILIKKILMEENEKVLEYINKYLTSTKMLVVINIIRIKNIIKLLKKSLT
ncbi:glycosyltransferase [Patescibacteria group bacterium]|nr:glycosyltransferase [Patescibacteria group bacterium]